MRSSLRRNHAIGRPAQRILTVQTGSQTTRMLAYLPVYGRAGEQEDIKSKTTQWS
jgi:hypothetical protein